MIAAIPIIAENRIHEAMDRGEFEHLEGVGRPFRNLSGYDDPDWWIKHKLQREQLSAQDAALPAKESRS
ncbi:MAG TPA: DnaJ family domain-containing protein [Verrucomicrobiae bacterium]|nr:DnaJ family domain-containing protein [Verrucomicrobiae bacterium]